MLLLLASLAAALAAPRLLPAGPPVVVGPRPTDEIEAAVSAQAAALHGCAALPPPAGHLGFKLRVEPDGAVSRVEIVSAPPATEGLASCVGVQLGRLTLPPARAATVIDLRFALLPAAEVLPRTRLHERLVGCGALPPLAVVATVHVQRGSATRVDLSALPGVDAAARACVQRALEIGPHRMGTGTRIYAWGLGEGTAEAADAAGLRDLPGPPLPGPEGDQPR